MPLGVARARPQDSTHDSSARPRTTALGLGDRRRQLRGDPRRGRVPVGARPVLSGALLLIASGSALSVVMTADWQLILLWGVLVGVGTGAISMGFVATVATRWFESRRGLVTGVLTAASATGQLIFLPVVAEVTTRHGWRWASLIVAAAALAVVPLVAIFMRNHPQDKGLTAYGGTATEPAVVPASRFKAAFDGLRIGARVPAVWLLAGSFAICGMTT